MSLATLACDGVARRRRHGARALARALALAAMLSWGGSASAQVSGLAAQDSTKPIEITADQLVVEQNQRIATFSGSVDAVQGGMRLTAQRLVVHYGESGEAGAADNRSIRRIEAFGDVLVSSAGETAQGRTGVYDVAGAALSLEGDVVLTREGNVVRGERLDVDLRSGKSTLKAATNAGRGRVRALFKPASGEDPAP